MLLVTGMPCTVLASNLCSGHIFRYCFFIAFCCNCASTSIFVVLSILICSQLDVSKEKTKKKSVHENIMLKQNAIFYFKFNKI